MGSFRIFNIFDHVSSEIEGSEYIINFVIEQCVSGKFVKVVHNIFNIYHCVFEFEQCRDKEFTKIIFICETFSRSRAISNNLNLLSIWIIRNKF